MNPKVQQISGINPTRADYPENGVVSVIIPTYNRSALLQRAIASVQTQTYPHVEILVVDDGSTDDSAQMVRGLNDPRIKFLASDTNRGGGVARWRGAENASGDYIAYLDSDDYWLPQKLERQLAVLHASDCEMPVILNPPMIARGVEFFPSAQPPLRAKQHIAEYVYFVGGALQTSCFLMPAALGRRLRFNTNLRVNQDTDYLLRLADAGANFIYLQEHLHVQDIGLRADRISANKELLPESMAWFSAASKDWPSRARRGYYMVDLSLRHARNGLRLKGLWYFVRGLDVNRPQLETLRYLLRIVGGGDLPRLVQRIMRRT